MRGTGSVAVVDLGTFTLSTTIKLTEDDTVKYWRLRESREEVKIVVALGKAARLQYRAVLAKFDPKSDDKGKTTASVEWVMGKPHVLKD